MGRAGRIEVEHEEAARLVAWLAAHPSLPPLAGRHVARIRQELPAPPAPVAPDRAREAVDAWVRRRLGALPSSRRPGVP